MAVCVQLPQTTFQRGLRESDCARIKDYCCAACVRLEDDGAFPSEDFRVEDVQWRYCVSLQSDFQLQSEVEENKREV